MKQGKEDFKRIEPEILKNYLEGRGNKEQQQKIADWFSDLLADGELRDYTKTRWDKIPENLTTKDLDSERIHDRIHHLIRLEEAAANGRKQSRIRLIGFITRAAAVLLIPLVVFTMYNWRNTYKSRFIPSSEIHSPLGSRTSFVLPDGSTGWLNGGSTLRFPARFNGKCRLIIPDKVYTGFGVKCTTPLVIDS